MYIYRLPGRTADANLRASQMVFFVSLTFMEPIPLIEWINPPE